MPVYLLHGFRWPRPLVRIHIILQNLDDAAAEWLVAPDTTATLLDNFHELYPDIMENLPQLRFIEQYDPGDERSGSQPYAYIADIVHEIKLGADIDELRGKGVSNEQWGGILELRDKLVPEEKVGWYVVICGDEQRWVPGMDELASTGNSTPTARSVSSPNPQAAYRQQLQILAHSSSVQNIRNAPHSPPTNTVPNRSVSDARSIRTASTDTVSQSLLAVLQSVSLLTCL